LQNQLQEITLYFSNSITFGSLPKVDMSEQAVLRRLKTVDQLRELCLLLMKAKKDSDEKAEKNRQTGAKSEIKK